VASEKAEEREDCTPAGSDQRKLDALVAHWCAMFHTKKTGPEAQERRENFPLKVKKGKPISSSTSWGAVTLF